MIKESSDTVITCFSLTSKVILLCAFAYALAEEQMVVSELIALTAYIDMAFTPILSLKKNRDDLNEFTIRFQKIEESLALNHRKSVPLLCSGRYELKNASLAYSTNNQLFYVFRDFSYTFQGITGIVGFSGAGKSSLIQMLLGGLQGEGGCLFAGLPVQKMEQGNLLSVINYYPQTPEIFDDTLEFNITLGKSPLTETAYNKHVEEKTAEILAIKTFGETEQTIVNEIAENLLISDRNALADRMVELSKCKEKAAYLAKIVIGKNYYDEQKYAELINMLGLEKLGNRRLGSGGKSVSGGEKAKIALARFLLCDQGGFFILDEPFTNIDIISMECCIEAFQKYCRGRDGIIILHNLSLIRRICKPILVLEQNGNPSFGNFSSLLRESETFRLLWEEFEKFHAEDILL